MTSDIIGVRRHLARIYGDRASIGLFALADLTDPNDELRSAAAFTKDARIEADEQGGTTTTATATTRLLRASRGFVRCYVKGGTEEERATACRAVRVVSGRR